jgi:hypothetical protein
MKFNRRIQQSVNAGYAALKSQLVANFGHELSCHTRAVPAKPLHTGACSFDDLGNTESRSFQLSSKEFNCLRPQDRTYFLRRKD